MKRRRTVVVSFRGMEYDLDLAACEHALLRRQIDGEVDSMEGLAETIDVSRSTVSRFFGGRQTSLSVTLKILSRLKLAFDDVCKPHGVDGGSPNGSG